MARARERHFEEFRDHTRLKHAVLTAYLETWIRKLLLRPGAGDRVYFVDAFAGTGMDEEGNNGSPMLAAKTAAKAEGQLGEMLPGRAIHVHTIAIEKDAGRYRELAANLAPFGERTRALHGTLSQHMDDIFTEIGEAPTLFFIDPFGLDGLELRVMARALRGPRNEVLALFADQAALRHFGAAQAREDNLEKAIDDVTAQGLLFTDLHEETVAAERARVVTRNRGVQTTREHALRILTAAFGGEDWMPYIESLRPGVDRRLGFIRVYGQRLAVSGARYTLFFPIRDERNKIVYHLVHASKHPRGKATMKEAIHAALRKSQLPASTVYSIVESTAFDMDLVLYIVGNQFAGKTVQWTAEKGPSVKRFLLEEMDVFPWDFPKVKAGLRGSGFQVPGPGPIRYTFPQYPGQPG